MNEVKLYLGDCLEVMPTLAENSIDGIVTDPPYGLQFMGKDWDKGVPGIRFWQEALRVCKPGAHLLAFGGTRTHHRLACAIEDAGWEIRDEIMWVHGQGFPKSLDVSKAIDKAAGAEREVMGFWKPTGTARPNINGSHSAAITTAASNKYNPDIDAKLPITLPATEAARQWAGYGTALKPAVEPIILARKPLEGTVAANVLKWGTGALNIDAGRVGTDDDTGRPQGTMPPPMDWGNVSGKETFVTTKHVLGRWPANLIHDGSEEVLNLFPQSEVSGSAKNGRPATGIYSKPDHIFPGFGNKQGVLHNDSGSAARFFYCAKASRTERGDDNGHPTVKPLALMRYLITLIAPPNAVILDPFMGSGSTGVACIQLNKSFVGIEIDKDYYQITEARIKDAQKQIALPIE